MTFRNPGATEMMHEKCDTLSGRALLPARFAGRVAEKPWRTVVSVSTERRGHMVPASHRQPELRAMLSGLQSLPAVTAPVSVVWVPQTLANWLQHKLPNELHPKTLLSEAVCWPSQHGCPL